MSDNKVNGAGSNSWGLSTLVEAAMGEPEATTTSDAGAPAQKEVARNQQDSSQQDSFEQDGGSEADDFMAWAGAKATSMSEDASKLIDEGMETVSTTVGDLLQGAGDAGTGSAPISEKHVDGLRDLSKVVDRTANEIREAANDVSQTAEDVEILDAETNRKLDRLFSMGANEFLTLGLEGIGLDESKRAEIESNTADKVNIARHAVTGLGNERHEDGNFGLVRDFAANAAAATASLLGDAETVTQEYKEAFGAAKKAGEIIQDGGQVMPPNLGAFGSVMIGVGVALEKIGDSPEKVAAAKQNAVLTKAIIENIDPASVAEQVANLEEGETLVYKLGTSVDAHEVYGGKAGFAHEMKLERKGGKILLELKGEYALGAGFGASAQKSGVSLDAVGTRSLTFNYECNEDEVFEVLGNVLKVSMLDFEAASELELPDSFHCNKVIVTDGDFIESSLGMSALAGLGFKAGTEMSVGLVDTKGGDGKASAVLELAGKAEASLGLKGTSLHDDVSPRELREQLVNVEQGNFGEFFQGFPLEAFDAMGPDSMPKPGDQLKIASEMKCEITVPAYGVEDAGDLVGNTKMVFSQKTSLVVKEGMVDFELKMEIKDPLGLAEAIGMDVAELSQSLNSGELTLKSLQDELGDTFFTYATVENKVEQRFGDSAGIFDVEGVTATRTKISKPLNLFSAKLDQNGFESEGVVVDATEKAVETFSKDRDKPRELRMSDFTHHVIKG